MDSEDDICILPHPDEDLDIDAGFSPVIPFSPFAVTSTAAVHPGSHYALEKAYHTLKHKLRETKVQNLQLAHRVRQLDASSSALKAKRTEGEGLPDSDSFLGKTSTVSQLDQVISSTRFEDLDSVSLRTQELESFVKIGESFDMMEEVRYVGESGQVGGQMMTQGEMEIRLNRYKEVLLQKSQAVNSLTQQVAQLQEDKRRLQQILESERGERERAIQSLQERCLSLEQERDKAQKEAAMLQASLKKTSVELAMVKEKEEECRAGDQPLELVSELAHMRRVIDKLKTMVLLQKDCLVNQSMSLSRSNLSQSPRDISTGNSMELPTLSLCSPSPSQHNITTTSGSAVSGSHSGQSWEMVNGMTSHQPTSADLRLQQLQQRSAKMIPVDLGPRRDGSMKASVSGQPTGNIDKAVPGVTHNGAAMLNIQNEPTAISNLSNQKPRVDAMPRRNSDNPIQNPPSSRVSEAAAPRAHTLPQQTQRGTGLAQWMIGNHYIQQAGLNQFMKDAPSPSRFPTETGQRMGSPSRPLQPMGMQYASSSSSSPSTSNLYHENQQQPSPVSQPQSTYDNITIAATMPSSVATSNHGNTGPSMHILNQSSMTGGRVLQNSGNFANENGGGSVMASNLPTTVSVNRDGVGSSFRGSPQEHSEVPVRALNPTDLQLNTQEIHFVNELPAGAGLDRKCPVCGQDFSHITMDEFQNHVFECFDDSDDVSNAPETLQAPAREGQVDGGTLLHNRVCPMCEKSFTTNVSQEYFESHVQSHFEEVINHFEVLDFNRS